MIICTLTHIHAHDEEWEDVLLEAIQILSNFYSKNDGNRNVYTINAVFFMMLSAKAIKPNLMYYFS